MNNLIILLLLFFCAIIISCCDEMLGDDEKMTLNKVDYTGNYLKLNGYYFRNDISRCEIFIFYRNGVILHGGYPYIAALAVREEEFRNGEFSSFAKKYKISWGAFKIDSNKIEFEMWYGVQPFQVFNSSGLILNDTIFIITRLKHIYGSEDYAKSDTFHFKQFSPKPDSMNRWVK
jgi:hypothetical protein